MNKCLYILLLFVLYLLPGYAQEVNSWADVGGDRDRLEQYLSRLNADERIDRDSLMSVYRSGYEQFLRDGYPEGQAELLLRLGALYSAESMFTAAAEAFEESLSVLAKLGDETKIARAYAGLGTALGRRGAYDESAANLLEALRIYEQAGDQPGIANTYLKLGTVHTYIDNLDLGLEYFQKALDIAQVHDKGNVVTIYANIAFIYMEQGDFDKSEEYFKQAISYTEASTSLQSRTLAFLNLGQLYQIQGKELLADRYFDQAAELAAEGDLHEEMIAIELIRIDESTPTGKATALNMLIELREQAREYELNYMQFEILSKMTELGKALGWYEQTVQWLEERVEIEKQLLDERKTRDIANLQATYELDKSRQEIEELNALIFSQSRIKWITFIFSGFLIAGFMIAIYYYVRARRTNRLLAIREKELSASVEEKDRLFSVIGHDLKNAISSQPIVLGLLKSAGEDKEEHGRLMEGLETSIYDVLYVLDTLLHWGKMQFKGVTVQPVRFDVHDLAQESVRLLRLSAQLKNLEIINRIPPGTFILADKEQFKFVMRNLLSNAIKYSRRGGEVTIAVHHTDTQEVAFLVEDHGIGMDEQERKTLFDPDRLSTPGTANEAGSGIALLLSHEFVTKNSGRIWVESEKGKGTTFYFAFPTTENVRSMADIY